MCAFSVAHFVRCPWLHLCVFLALFMRVPLWSPCVFLGPLCMCSLTLYVRYPSLYVFGLVLCVRLPWPSLFAFSFALVVRFPWPCLWVSLALLVRFLSPSLFVSLALSVCLPWLSLSMFLRSLCAFS